MRDEVTQLKFFICRSAEEETRTVHRDNLLAACRFCGTSSLQRSLHKKEHYVIAFKELYDIDIDQDDPDIHPASMCRAHEQILERYLTLRKSGGTFTTRLKPREFQPHSKTECCVCSDLLMKRKKGVKTKPDTALRMPERIERKFVPPPCQAKHTGDQMADLLVNCHDLPETFSRLLSRMDLDQRKELAYQLGSAEGNNIFTDCEEISSQYRDLQYLQELLPGKWIQGRNQSMFSFLAGVAGCGRLVEQETERTQLRLAIIIEQLYRFRSAARVFPWSFLTSLDIYKRTGSKEAVNVLSAAYSAPSYYALQNWLDRQGGEEINYPSGLLFHIFDNEQVLGRKTGVMPSNQARFSIITNVAYCNLEENNTIQEDEDMMPKYLTFLEPSIVPTGNL